MEFDDKDDWMFFTEYLTNSPNSLCYVLNNFRYPVRVMIIEEQMNRTRRKLLQGVSYT